VDGETALMVAAVKCNEACVVRLVEGGASLGVRVPLHSKLASTCHTDLMEAVCRGKGARVVRLVEAWKRYLGLVGARELTYMQSVSTDQYSMQSVSTGDSALHLAARAGNLGICRALVGVGDASMSLRNAHDSTALKVAEGWGKVEVVAFLKGCVRPKHKRLLRRDAVLGKG
jgi:ankyrin repeat protein